MSSTVSLLAQIRKAQGNVQRRVRRFGVPRWAMTTNYHREVLMF